MQIRQLAFLLLLEVQFILSSNINTNLQTSFLDNINLFPTNRGELSLEFMIVSQASTKISALEAS